MSARIARAGNTRWPRPLRLLALAGALTVILAGCAASPEASSFPAAYSRMLS